MKSYFLILTLLLASGCTGSKYCRGLVGATKNDVINKLGIPSREYQSDNTLYFEYFKNLHATSAAMPIYGVTMGSSYIEGTSVLISIIDGSVGSCTARKYQ